MESGLLGSHKVPARWLAAARLLASVLLHDHEVLSRVQIIDELWRVPVCGNVA